MDLSNDNQELLDFMNKTSHFNVMYLSIFVDSDDDYLKQLYIKYAKIHNFNILNDPFYDAGFDVFLPTNNNNLWANSMPQADADLKNINLLNPSQLVGINTQGSSLRNSNLQLRSEPPNPRTNTNCPWNISTIETDQFRKPLEIGT